MPAVPASSSACRWMSDSIACTCWPHGAEPVHTAEIGTRKLRHAQTSSLATLVSCRSSIGITTFGCAVSDRLWIIAAQDQLGPDVRTWLEYDTHAATHRALAHEFDGR